MTEVDLRFLENRGEYERINVGMDIYIILWKESGLIGFEHTCAGIWQHPSEVPSDFRVAPLWPGEVVSRDPLTLRPSLFCLGSAKPCGLHGFVENGVWRSV